MNKGVKIGLCATAGFIGFCHGLYIRHQYKQQDLGAQFAQSVNSATDSIKVKTQDLHLAQNYNSIVLKGKDTIVATVGGGTGPASQTKDQQIKEVTNLNNQNTKE